MARKRKDQGRPATPAKKDGEKDRRTGTLWEPVDLTPEQIALACMQGPPKKKWEYLKGKNE